MSDATVIFVLVPLALVAVAGAVVTWFENRPRRRPRGVVVPIVDEAAADLTLKAWSPTRGTYGFRAVDLPAAYLTLAGVNDGAIFQQFGEDEDDARRELAHLLFLRFHKQFRTMPPVIGPDVKSSSFKPLNKRKKDRTP